MASASQPPSVEFATAQYDRARLFSLFDVALCGGVVLALLLNVWLARETPVRGPIIVVGAIGLYAVIHRWRLPRVLTASAALLLLPLFALLSALWSIDMDATLRYGILYLLTVILGVMFGAGMKSEDVLKGIFWALFVYGILSISAGQTMAIGVSAEVAFIGYQASKNQAGEIAGITLLTSTVMAAFAGSRRSFWLLCAALVGIVMGAYTLYASKAIGALIACGIAWLCTVAWLISRRLSRQARGAIFVLAAVTIGLMLLTLEYWLPPMFELVLETSGKDRGLTGRDFIWRFADDMIARNPVLGIGYSSFWLDNNLDALHIIREMGVSDPRGFNFHSTYREIAVHLGLVGLAIYALVFLVSSLILLGRTMVVASYPLILASSFLVYFCMKLPLESFGFSGMHLLSMLTYTILAMGYSSLLWRNKPEEKTFA